MHAIVNGDVREDGKRYGSIPDSYVDLTLETSHHPFFLVKKKGIDHGEIVMIRGCRFELCADGIGCSEFLLPY